MSTPVANPGVTPPTALETSAADIIHASGPDAEARLLERFVKRPPPLAFTPLPSLEAKRELQRRGRLDELLSNGSGPAPQRIQNATSTQDKCRVYVLSEMKPSATSVMARDDIEEICIASGVVRVTAPVGDMRLPPAPVAMPVDEPTPAPPRTPDVPADMDVDLPAPTITDVIEAVMTGARTDVDTPAEVSALIVATAAHWPQLTALLQRVASRVYVATTPAVCAGTDKMDIALVNHTTGELSIATTSKMVARWIHSVSVVVHLGRSVRAMPVPEADRHAAATQWTALYDAHLDVIRAAVAMVPVTKSGQKKSAAVK